MSNQKKHFSNAYDLLVCITKAIDLVSPDVTNHHQQVAYIANNIAEEMLIAPEGNRNLIVASLLHDVGAIAFHQKFEFLEEEKKDVHEHAFMGASLLSDFVFLKEISNYIRFHHVPWNKGEGAFFQNMQVPLLSHIIHLADRVICQIDRKQCIISQSEYIKEYVKSEKGKLFPEGVVDAFLSVCNRESFWLDLFYKPTISIVTGNLSLETIQFTLDEVVDLTKIFSRIIDFRSPFTAMHSAGVAGVAVKVAELAGMSGDECKHMHIAGNLHDIGKLAVSRDIIEKSGKLDADEYDEMRTHTYYTYRLLFPVQGFENITQWAAYHHEKLDGSGYPFHLNAENLSLGARIMAVADIFTAITEDRPYREGMPKDKVIEILNSMVKNNCISSFAVNLIINNYDEILFISRKESKKAKISYETILNK